MHRNIIQLLIKITSISLWLIIIINLFTYFFISEKYIASSDNSANFKNSDVPVLSNIWVAISTNVWIWFQQKTSLQIFSQSLTLEQIITWPDVAKKDLINKNMILINEYLNVLKTDIPSLLEWDINKEKTIDILARELISRYNNANLSMKNLILQKQVLADSMDEINKKVDDLKIKISLDFNKFDWISTWENIDNYLLLRKNYYFANVYSVFINKFINQYSFLNNYNKELINVLKNNKKAIINDSFIVLPTNWDWLLRKLNLIYDEAEYNANLEKLKSQEQAQ